MPRAEQPLWCWARLVCGSLPIRGGMPGEADVRRLCPAGCNSRPEAIGDSQRPAAIDGGCQSKGRVVCCWRAWAVAGVHGLLLACMGCCWRAWAARAVHSVASPAAACGRSQPIWQFGPRPSLCYSVITQQTSQAAVRMGDFVMASVICCLIIPKTA
eukprot:295247-Chlamydomonas_euryale.AAC.1